MTTSRVLPFKARPKARTIESPFRRYAERGPLTPRELLHRRRMLEALCVLRAAAPRNDAR